MGRRFQKKGVLNNFPAFSFQNFPHVLAEACITEDFPRSQGGVVALSFGKCVPLCMLCVNLKHRGSTALRPSILDRPSQVVPRILSTPQLEHGNLVKVPTDFVTPAVTWTLGTSPASTTKKWYTNPSNQPLCWCHLLKRLPGCGDETLVDGLH